MQRLLGAASYELRSSSFAKSSRSADPAVTVVWDFLNLTRRAFNCAALWSPAPGMFESK